MKEKDIERLLKAKDISEFYDIYFENFPNGGVLLKDIDYRLVEKEKQLLKEIPKEQTVEFGRDVFKKENTK